jgi:hypothetical protein
MSPSALLLSSFRVSAILITIVSFALAASERASPADSAPTINKSNTTVPRDLPNPQALMQKLNAERPIFIENRGQWDSRVKFQVKTRGGALWLTNDGIVFDFVRPKQGNSPNSQALTPPLDSKDRLPELERLVFQQKFVAPNASPTIEARDPLPGIYNYFYGSDPNKWRSHVKGYPEVTYHNVWAGVDLKLSADGPNLEEAFIVHPGADPAAVRLAYEGIEGLKTNDDGSLEIATSFGDLVETTPRIYQEKSGKPTPVDGHFKFAGNAYSFEVTKRDETADLIIDPTIILTKSANQKSRDPGMLLYSSFLGGNAQDYAYAVAVDSSGAALVTGRTISTNFPTTVGAFQGPNPTPSDWAVFLTKVSPLGDQKLFSSILGPGVARGVAVDNVGNSYVVGLTRSDGTPGKEFPTTSSAYSDCGGHGYGVSADFVAKLPPAGDRLLYSTCIGTADLTYTVGVAGVAVDSSGKAYITGTTIYSIPTTLNAYDPVASTTQQPFFSVIDTNASGQASLYYSTYFGGHDKGNIFGTNGAGTAVAVDAFGKAYVTGWTYGTGFPTTSGAYQTDYYGLYYCGNRGIGIENCESAYVAKFDPSAATGPQSLIYSTLLAGNNATTGNAIATDGLGNAYIAGTANFWGNGTKPFPTTDGAFQKDGLGSHAFVTKLNAAGNNLVYSTMLGDPRIQQEQGFAVAVDAAGEAYVAGVVRSQNGFPVTPDAWQATSGGDNDAFIIKFNASGSQPVYSSYLGGINVESGSGVAVDSVGDAYVVGLTGSLNFPITSHAFQPIAGGGTAGDCYWWGPACDAFITKVPIGSSEALSIQGIAPNAGGNAGQVTPEMVGTGFHNGATAKLDCGGNQVIGSNVTITGFGRIVRATFDLTSSSPGSCDVVVTNPDQTSAKLAQGFTVQQGGAPDLHTQKIGTVAVPGFNMTYLITVENRGNVDAPDMTLSEYLEPWFTLGGVIPPAQSIIALNDLFPPSSDGMQYNAILLWDTPPSILAAKSNSNFAYTVNLDRAFPLGFTVRGEVCFTVPQCEGIRDGCLDAIKFTCSKYQDLKERAACVRAHIDACEETFNACMDDISLNAAHCSGASTQSMGPRDPNYVVGATGVGVQQWISGASGLAYVISFGNDPNAQVAAQQVLVTQPLDANLDVSTSNLSFVTVPNLSSPTILVTIPSGSFNPAVGKNEFSTNIDLRPTQSLL